MTDQERGAAVMSGKTRVVNLRRDRYDVYIGRAGHGHDGYFGNPLRIGASCGMCGERHGRDAALLRCYERWLAQRLDSDERYRGRVLGLAGKTLGCFCKPGVCHGDVLAAYADRLAAENGKAHTYRVGDLELTDNREAASLARSWGLIVTRHAAQAPAQQWYCRYGKWERVNAYGAPVMLETRIEPEATAGEIPWR